MYIFSLAQFVFERCTVKILYRSEFGTTRVLELLDYDLRRALIDHTKLVYFLTTLEQCVQTYFVGDVHLLKHVIFKYFHELAQILDRETYASKMSALQFDQWSVPKTYAESIAIFKFEQRALIRKKYKNN